MEEFLQNMTCIAFNYIDTNLDLIFCFEIEICYSGNLSNFVYYEKKYQI